MKIVVEKYGGSSLASGAQVFMQNAVEIAQNSGVNIIVGSSYERNEGTLISS